LISPYQDPPSDGLFGIRGAAPDQATVAQPRRLRAVHRLLLPASVVVGVLAAVVPARRARRQRVSELLRVE
jgi:hypothetical protein